MKYLILREGSPSKLESLVEEKLNQGWSLQGGLSVATRTYVPDHGYTNREGHWYSQAIVKEPARPDVKP